MSNSRPPSMGSSDNLSQFGLKRVLSTLRIRRHIMKAVIDNMSPEEIVALKVRVELADLDNSGSVTVSQLCEILKKTGATSLEAEVCNVLEKLEAESNMELTYDEFLVSTFNMKRSNNAGDVVTKLDKLDLNKSDDLSASQLKQTLDGINLGQEEIEELNAAGLRHFLNAASTSSDSGQLPPASPTRSVSSSSGTASRRRRSLSSDDSIPTTPGSAREGTPDPPEEFICPLSLDIMVDPVIVDSGQTYERSFITRWIKDGNLTCPKTRQPLTGAVMYPNQILRDMIGEWCEKYKVTLPNFEDQAAADAIAEAKADLEARVKADRAAAVAFESERRQRAAMEEMRRQGRQQKRTMRTAGAFSARDGGREPGTSAAAGAAGATVAATAAAGSAQRPARRGSGSGSGSGSASGLASDPAAGSVGGSGRLSTPSRPSSGRPPSGRITSGDAALLADLASINDEPADNEAEGEQSSGERERLKRTVTRKERRKAQEEQYGSGMPANFNAGGGLALSGWPGKLAMKAAVFRTQPWEMDGEDEAEEEEEEEEEKKEGEEGRGEGKQRDVGAEEKGVPKRNALTSEFEKGARRRLRDSADLGIVANERAISERDMARSLARELRRASSTRSNDTDSSSVAGTDEESVDVDSVAATEESIQGLDVRQLLENARSGEPEDKAAAAALLRVMTRQGFQFGSKIINLGGIPLMISLLTSDDESTVEHAATVLLNLSLEGNVRQAIFEAGAIPPLIAVLSTGILPARANAAAALFSISRCEGAREAIRDAGAIPDLVHLLECGTLRGKKDAANALVSLCMSRENRSALAQSGAVKVLGDLQRDGLDSLEEQTAAIFAGLVRDPEGREVLVRDGAIELLAELVDEGSSLCREYAVNALLGLGVNKMDWLKLIDEEGIAATLDVLSRTGTPKTQSKAKTLLDMLHKLEGGMTSRRSSGRF